MTLSPGARLGPYEILAPLGSGGMGEVYRAKDGRLSREVALKVLHEEVAGDPTRLKRFEKEARSASALNHPNIVTIYDVGTSGSVSWIAMERVDGQTLRQAFHSSAVPVRKLLPIAVQIADGLASAHEVGIVHRDLKPENVMVTRDGLVKILDFGLAKLAPAGPVADDRSPASRETETFPGAVLGTVGYMSPEQAAGRPADFRSDQFSLGTILYEMATGTRPFQKKTSVETLTAILNEDPRPVGEINPEVPVPLRWIVERCLSKEPNRRYASTRDLARELETVKDHSSEISGVSAPGSIFSAPRRRIRGLALALLVVGTLAAGMAVGRREGRWEPPSFRRLTFREGEVSAARFAPDGQTILYSAAWKDSPIELFLHRLGSPESRPLGISNASLQAISSLGEMAVLLNPYQRWNTGTLARMPMVSVGAPREILEQVNSADWSPDGRELAIIHDDAKERSTLEFPIGSALYKARAGFLSHARVSRDGRRVAFLDHPINLDDSGNVVVVDRTGKSRVLATGFETIWGLDWSPDGREVWFTGAPTGMNRALYAVSLSGRQRVLARFSGLTKLEDVDPSGRSLVIQDIRSEHVMALAPGEEKERELTWLDLSNSRAISSDGRMVLLLESGEGGGPGYSTFLRKTDGSPAVRLGDGDGQAFSPDGRWVAAIRPKDTEPSIVLYPTGAGEPRRIPVPGLEPQYLEWMPDGKQILLSAGQAGHSARLYLVSLSGGKPRAISAEGYTTFSTGSVSPDGKRAVVWGPGDRLFLYPLDGGEPVPLPGFPAGAPCGWTADGTHLYVIGMKRTIPQRVDLLDVRTGKRELWKELGVRAGATSIHVTPDGRSYVYSFARSQEDLYLLEGLK